MTKKINISSIEKATNKLRNKIDAADYYKVILSIVFLKFVTSQIEWNWNNYKDDMTYEEFIETIAGFDKKINQIDQEFLWTNIKNCEIDKIKQKLDGAFMSLEKHQPELARDLSIFSFQASSVQVSSIAKVIEIVDDEIEFDNENFSDTFGTIYEHFIGKYSITQKRGGEFYTPHSLVELMTSITEFRLKNKEKIQIYDPTMGSAGMLVQSLTFLTKNNISIDRIKFFGQEMNQTPWKIARMNFLLRGVNYNFGIKEADTFLEDLHSKEKFDVILSNPPFNEDFDKENYGNLINDPRFKKYGLIYGSGRANYNFFNLIISHLNETGVAAVVMQAAAGTSGPEESIRKRYIEDNVVEAIIQLPQNVFTNTSIPSTVWIFNKNKIDDQILFVDLSQKTKRSGTVEVFENTTIEEAQAIFAKRFSGEVINLDFAKSIDRFEILNKYSARLSVQDHVKIEKEVITLSPQQLALEIETTLNEFEENLDEMKEVIKKLNNM